MTVSGFPLYSVFTGKEDDGPVFVGVSDKSV